MSDSVCCYEAKITIYSWGQRSKKKDVDCRVCSIPLAKKSEETSEGKYLPDTATGKIKPEEPCGISPEVLLYYNR
jgi:hypothetical protein